MNPRKFDDDCILYLKLIQPPLTLAVDCGQVVFVFAYQGFVSLAYPCGLEYLFCPHPHVIHNVRGQNKDICDMYYCLSFVIFRLHSLVQPIADRVALNLEIIFETF